MNPAPMNPEFVPLQGMNCTGQRGAQIVQSTTVNIITEPPRDHIIWSLCHFVYGNLCCLGLVAVIYSIMARDRKVAGDLEGARHYGSTARYFNIISTVLFAVGCLSCLIAVICVAAISSNYYHYNSYGNNYYGK